MTNAITEDHTRTLTTRQALRLIRNAASKTHFMLKVETFLPVPASKDNQGFSGITYLTVSRRQFSNVVKNILGEILEGRGGRIKLKFHAPNHSTGNGAITL